MRITAKGKKLGTLVGFTFQQPAIFQALGLPCNLRELCSYLMYEPFQQAWMQMVMPSQTVTLCEGGGVMYQHPHVRVTLWLDNYVREIYPNWVHSGTTLRDLVAVAAQSGSAQLSKPTLPKCATSLAPVIDLMGGTLSPWPLKHKRSLVLPLSLVDLSLVNVGKGARLKCRRTCTIDLKLKGKGTSEELYIL